ncbi:Uncharacterised protein [Raoultella terrigena]|uniref:Uncharacterized protein n=1 Tax=Raoultella terrigena TaxID=577 RepID=A0A4U9D013_RAOTE|nr:Uncharacterised protein [Raoultella terrigena]
MQHQFAQRAEDKEGEQAADQIHQGQRGPRHLQARAGAEEQTGTDCAADGDHLHLAVAHCLVVTRFLRVEPVTFCGLMLGRGVVFCIH